MSMRPQITVVYSTAVSIMIASKLDLTYLARMLKANQTFVVTLTYLRLFLKKRTFLYTVMKTSNKTMDIFISSLPMLRYFFIY